MMYSLSPAPTHTNAVFQDIVNIIQEASVYEK